MVFSNWLRSRKICIYYGDSRFIDNSGKNFKNA
jgi:hypothetical protein